MAALLLVIMMCTVMDLGGENQHKNTRILNFLMKHKAQMQQHNNINAAVFTEFEKANM